MNQRRKFTTIILGALTTIFGVDKIKRSSKTSNNNNFSTYLPQLFSNTTGNLDQHLNSIYTQLNSQLESNNLKLEELKKVAVTIDDATNFEEVKNFFDSRLNQNTIISILPINSSLPRRSMISIDCIT